MKKVELLAPAGNYEAFVGAIHAGADAVYLGGTKYSARAFADNFDEETLCKAIFYAHLFGRKVYLTINTLVKQSELDELYDFLRPFYENGLDGVIVQDFGVLKAVKKYFPQIEVHISTQMCITGPNSARMMKELGASRVVPARELSLEEMKLLKKEGLDIETFIHGAMCYCYSGRCFFSSLLGGRSGNRGKCAQSCRLPYQTNLPEVKSTTNKTEEYPLSLKDMCTVTRIPQLVESGIDSFKIEGRMKRPEYAAGVTAIYRKYIDLYYEKGEAGFQIDEKDLEKLEHLYIRSEIQDGYYYRYNGPEMVTLEKPGYAGTDEKLAESIYETYIKQPLKAEVKGTVYLYKDAPVTLTLDFNETSVTATGAVAGKAIKAAVRREDVDKQLRKTGNTDFVFSELSIEMEEDVFLPMKALNELRREAFEELYETLLRAQKRPLCEEDKTQDLRIIESKRPETGRQLLIFLSQKEHCLAALREEQPAILGIPSHLLKDEEVFSHLKEAAHKGRRIWIRLPEVIRYKDHNRLKEILECSQDISDGMVVSDLETFGFLKKYGYSGQIMLNHHIYAWNQESLSFLEDQVQVLMAPLECNIHVWKQLESPKVAYLCYGRIPMMVTANCIRKTKDTCRTKDVTLGESLTDRYGKNFPVEINCDSCYNIVYNSVPLSLHTGLEQIERLPGGYLRLDFTTESVSEMMQLVKEYEKVIQKRPYDFSFLKEYTTGHLKKGAL